MIPYFQINSFIVGPVTVQIWGLFVSLGIVAGLLVSCFLIKKYFLSTSVLLDMTIWALIVGLIGARLVYVWFYALDYFLVNPWDVLKIWQGGASSLGGFLGAALALWLFAKKRHFTWNNFLPYLDVGMVGLWLGWGIGRLGCFLIHDHPGRLSSSFLAVKFSSGARFDLGLLESLLGFIIFVIFISLFKYLVHKRWGLVAYFSLGLYAITRFFFDFLRATDLAQSDIRYFNFTPAQWGMLIIILTLTFLPIFNTIMQRSKTKTGRVA